MTTRCGCPDCEVPLVPGSREWLEEQRSLGTVERDALILEKLERLDNGITLCAQALYHLLNRR